MTQGPMREHPNVTSESNPEKSVRVLLVEDSAVLAEILCEALSQLPEVDLVGAVDSETEAFRIIARDRVDLIFLDLQLKQGTGFGILRSLAAMNPAPRSVVLTNHDLPEYQTAAMALGATYFLDKARDFHRLPEIVRAIISVISVE
jgi:two-component system, OmpR family, response regulator